VPGDEKEFRVAVQRTLKLLKSGGINDTNVGHFIRVLHSYIQATSGPDAVTLLMDTHSMPGDAVNDLVNTIAPLNFQSDYGLSDTRIPVHALATVKETLNKTIKVNSTKNNTKSTIAR